MDLLKIVDLANHCPLNRCFIIFKNNNQYEILCSLPFHSLNEQYIEFKEMFNSMKCNDKFPELILIEKLPLKTGGNDIKLNIKTI